MDPSGRTKELSGLAQVEDFQYWKPASRRKVQMSIPARVLAFWEPPGSGRAQIFLPPPPPSCGVLGQPVPHLGSWSLQLQHHFILKLCVCARSG